MALLPPEYMDAVVALGVQDSDGVFQGTATGFIYGHPIGKFDEKGEPLFELFLVTNRHVVESVETLAVRFNRSMNVESKTYSIPLRDTSILWRVHPDLDCDVAVIPINAKLLGEDGIYYEWFRGDDANFLSISKARQIQVSEGDGVFVLGFPMGLVGEEYNYTIVRQGSIARIRDWLYGKSRTFLIDASVFPGNSGGPVILKPETAAIEGTKSNDTAYLIGMVSKYITHEDIAISWQTKKPRVVFTENSGLCVVVPMDVIQETIDLSINNVQPEGMPELIKQPPAQGKSPPRKPLGQWLVENMPRGINLEIPDRQASERPIPFADEESR